MEFCLLDSPEYIPCVLAWRSDKGPPIPGCGRGSTMGCLDRPPPRWEGESLEFPPPAAAPPTPPCWCCLCCCRIAIILASWDDKGQDSVQCMVTSFLDDLRILFTKIKSLTGCSLHDWEVHCIHTSGVLEFNDWIIEYIRCLTYLCVNSLLTTLCEYIRCLTLYICLAICLVLK